MHLARIQQALVWQPCAMPNTNKAVWSGYSTAVARAPVPWASHWRRAGSRVTGAASAAAAGGTPAQQGPTSQDSPVSC